jgi:hypothetical protein
MQQARENLFDRIQAAEPDMGGAPQPRQRSRHADEDGPRSEQSSSGT